MTTIIFLLPVMIVQFVWLGCMVADSYRKTGNHVRSGFCVISTCGLGSWMLHEWLVLVGIYTP